MVSLSARVSRAWCMIAQHVAARQKQHGSRDPRLLPGGRAGENSAHRDSHDADLLRIDLGS